MPDIDVLEGREPLAGGETTGSMNRAPIQRRGAPAGAREGYVGAVVTASRSVSFSRPSRALPSADLLAHLGPVVTPPANGSRVSGTKKVCHEKAFSKFSQSQSWQMPTLACLAALTLASCGQKEPTTAPVPEVSPKPAAAVSEAQIEAELTRAFAEAPAPQTTSSENDALSDEAEDILDQHPNKSAVDLLHIPEVEQSLKTALTRLGQDKKLQGQINSTVELAAKMKGLDGTPGSVGLDLDTKNYNREQKSRLLQAVLSEDPKRIVDFLVGEIGEAAPELSFGGKDRASNGIAIKENTPPAK